MTAEDFQGKREQLNLLESLEAHPGWALFQKKLNDLTATELEYAIDLNSSADKRTAAAGGVRSLRAASDLISSLRKSLQMTIDREKNRTSTK